MIIIKLISGLGNQLFQYVIGRQISLKTGLPLKLDLSFYETQDLRSYKLNKYNIKAEVLSVDEIAKYTNGNFDNFYLKVLDKLGYYLPKHKKRFYVEDKWWAYEPNVFKISSSIHIEGYWQHHKYYENIDPIVINELQLLEKYIYPIQTISNQINDDSCSVAVHIRRGDYITDVNANKLMGTLPLTYYFSAFSHIKSVIKSPNFYFFSDDLDWVKDNFKNLDNCYYVDSNTDYQDLHLMSLCKHTIIANSTFSWWAGFLNKNPEKIVICPRQWVIPDEINQDIKIQCPAWIQL